MISLLNENISHDELKTHIKEFCKFASKKLELDHLPRLFLVRDSDNANDFFGKTGGYDPRNKVIYLFITDRHPKDIVRSFSHELVHHAQNLQGFADKMNDGSIKDESYAQKDEVLMNLESDAFKRGNEIFRQWTDFKVASRKTQMNEKTEKMSKKVVEPKKQPPSDILNEAQEKEEKPASPTPYPELHEKKQRFLDDRLSQREKIVYDELMRKILKKDS